MDRNLHSATVWLLNIKFGNLFQMYGQVQQENKVFKSLEIMINYVENLKRTYENEHAELMDTKSV
jgi:inositol 1,4,5-triphosphate receptor-associated cGMP kinase